MDHHVPSAVTRGLRLLGIDVLTAQEDNAHRRQDQNIPFTGIVYAHQLRVPIGVCIRDLELIANVVKFEELENRVEYLPL